MTTELNPDTGLPAGVRWDGVQSHKSVHLVCFTDLVSRRSFSFPVETYSESALIARVTQLRHEHLHLTHPVVALGQLLNPQPK